MDTNTPKITKEEAEKLYDDYVQLDTRMDKNEITLELVRYASIQKVLGIAKENERHIDFSKDLFNTAIQRSKQICAFYDRIETRIPSFDSLDALLGNERVNRIRNIRERYRLNYIIDEATLTLD